MKVLLITTNAFKMSSNAITTQNNIDEFGRDLSLKLEKSVTSFIYGSSLAARFQVARFKGMSWADITYLIEEEEEEEKQREAEEKQREEDKVRQVKTEELRKILAVRKQLHQKGLYELEDGEELDI